MATIRGRARVYPRAHINTDEVIPARYLATADPTELAKHVLEDLDPEFPRTVRPGDILVTGEDFGCGSSREHAVWAIRGAAVQAVVANSFARIFFRNAVNNGFRVVECPGAAAAIEDGDEIEIDVEDGVVRVARTGASLTVVRPGEFAERLFAAGGLLAYVATQLRAAGSEAASAAAGLREAQEPAGPSRLYTITRKAD
ncbi:MAG: 3-isopropylmalate dehydratase small subunit [Gemmatimonadetes bacterium]|nr:3-isopropylmalate dehydratase small subunit [Gemmatimonadota bacterium]